MEKGKTFGDKKFAYKTKTIPIKSIQFKQFTDSLKSSNYWSQEYDFPCNNLPNDGSAFILEANTYQKYNVVRISDCGTNDSKIAKVFHMLIALAGLDKKIHIMGLPEYYLEESEIP